MGRRKNADAPKNYLSHQHSTLRPRVTRTSTPSPARCTCSHSSMTLHAPLLAGQVRGKRGVGWGAQRVWRKMVARAALLPRRRHAHASLCGGLGGRVECAVGGGAALSVGRQVRAPSREKISLNSSIGACSPTSPPPLALCQPSHRRVRRRCCRLGGTHCSRRRPPRLARAARCVRRHAVWVRPGGRLPGARGRVLGVVRCERGGGQRKKKRQGRRGRWVLARVSTSLSL